MNEITIKQVNFNDAELMALHSKDDNAVFTSINYMLRDLGFSEDQIKYQRDKWNTDRSISKGVRKFLTPSNGGSQETYCISIHKIPLALAKINITPKMESEMPALASKLEKYQDECADILAAAFIDKATSYSNKSTSVGEVVNLIKVLKSAMKEQNCSPTDIAKMIQTTCSQFNIILPSNFVKVNPYEQLTLTLNISTGGANQ